MSAGPIAAAIAAVQQAADDERRRTFPERLYRQITKAIDEAADLVEVVNLRGGGPCPDNVATLLVELQRLAGRPIIRPASSLDAHGELMDLSSVLLGRPGEGTKGLEAPDSSVRQEDVTCAAVNRGEAA